MGNKCLRTFHKISLLFSVLSLRLFSAGVLVALSVLIMVEIAGAQELVTFYTYHDKQPYFSREASQSTGFYQDVCDLMNSLQRDFKCVLKLFPRARLNEIIRKEGFDGVVMGVNPIWFGDKNKETFLWSAAFLHDMDVLVSNRSSPIEYLKEKMENKNFIGVRGYVHMPVDNWVKDGFLKRKDTNSELQNLLLVSVARADFTIVSKATFRYYLENGKIKDNYHLAKREFEIFERHFFLEKKKVELLDKINRVIVKMKSDSNWKKILSKNHLD